jgi:membrane protein YdbS with pleckstrin-like domain
MKEEKKYPLDLVGWVNYLMQEQNIEYFKFYNEVLSNFTIIIVILTLLNCVLVISTILFAFTFIDIGTKIILFMGIVLGILAIIIIISYLIFQKLPKSKRYTERITKCEANIIGGILMGDETDIHCILRRYLDCFIK